MRVVGDKVSYWGGGVDYTGYPESLVFGFYSQMVSCLNGFEWTGDIVPVLFQKGYSGCCVEIRQEDDLP